MGAKSVMKILAGLFGALAITFGILLIFSGLAGLNFIDNIDTFDIMLQDNLKLFIQENREDIRDFMSDQMADNLPKSKEEVLELCAQRQSLPLEAKKIISIDFCNDIKQMEFNEIKDYFLDQMADMNLDQISSKALPIDKGQIKEDISNIISGFGKISYLIFFGIAFFIVGCFLTFAAAGFKLVRGFYRIVLKTSINLITIGLFFVFFRYIRPKDIMGIIKATVEIMPELNVQAMPPLFMKLLAFLSLQMLRQATNPLILIAFGAAIPFIVITLLLLFLRLKDKGEMKGKEEKAE
ncbi:MAG: hypothetical protein U9Q69_03280 [Nanoarchaeota archaeon]|nr:hypothetical protein [Nanoarchaeota archaeon]